LVPIVTFYCFKTPISKIVYAHQHIYSILKTKNSVHKIRAVMLSLWTNGLLTFVLYKSR